MTAAPPTLWRTDLAWHREPRAWQAECLPLVTDRPPETWSGGVVRAATGAGKTGWTAELIRRWLGRVIVTQPSRQLVTDNAAAIVSALKLRESAGMVARDLRGPVLSRQYTKGDADPRCRIIIACANSIPALADRIEGDAAWSHWRSGVLWIADECHSTEAASWYTPMVDRILPTYRIGLSATPYLPSEDRTLTHWTHLVYRYTAGDAMRDGVIVPPREWTSEADISTPEALDAACSQWLRDRIADDLRDGHRPCYVVSGESRADCKAYAERLRGEGVDVEWIDCDTPDPERRRILGPKGPQVICHVRVLVEGVDVPWIRGMCLRAKRNRVRLVQEVGRGLRAIPGKLVCHVYDPHGLMAQHGLTADEAFAQVLDQPPDEARSRDVDENPDRLKLPPEILAEIQRSGVDIMGLPPWAQWARAAAVALEIHGLASLRRSLEWRREAPTPDQLALVRKAIANDWMRARPGSHADAVRACSLTRSFLAAAEASPASGRGPLSDIITVTLARFERETRRDRTEQWAAIRRKHGLLEWTT